MCIPAGIAFGYVYGGVVCLDDIGYYVELKPHLLLFLQLLLFVFFVFHGHNIFFWCFCLFIIRLELILVGDMHFGVRPF